MERKALAAEFVGAFALITATCGTALFSAPSGGNAIATALAAGLAMLAMSYALGHISGAHFNPAVTIGLIAAGRFERAKAVGYIVAQVAGAMAAVIVLGIVHGGALSPGPSAPAKWGTFATIANTYGGGNGFSMLSAFVAELTATAIFLVVFVGTTSRSPPTGFAPLAIGLALVALHLVTQPITNAALNPARATGPALMAGGLPVAQLWVFWAAPILGAVLGGVIGRYLQEQ